MSIARPETEMEELRRRLEEAEETLRAIRSGEVDALVVEGADGEQIFTLQGADHSFRILIEAMHQGAATLSGDGTVLYCNRSFAEMLNTPHEKVVGATITRFLSHSDRSLLESLLIKARSQSTQTELQLHAGDGTIRPVHLALNPFTLMHDSAICMIVTDLTEQKKHQDLQATNRRKDEFLAMLAHELRNPLAPILNAVAILNTLDQEDEKLAYANEIIKRQAHHLSRLVDDLLDLSRISLGKVKLQKERVELAEILARAVETSKPLIDARKHHLTLRLPPKGLWLDADATRLSQVVSNLLTNAAKYTEEGGALSLTTERDEGGVVIRVRDNGMGIPAELLPHVFDLFIQGDRSLARSEGGLGIGLTLVRRLAEMHGGTVQALSDGPGRGSEFILRLPVMAEQDLPREKQSGRTEEMNGHRSQRILVVEDNKDGADSLAMYLGMLGHQVSVAYNGSEALGLAEKRPYHAVLLDIGLPGINGYDVAKRLRNLRGYESTMLVALTGYGQDEDRQRSLEAGFQHHLVKPVDLKTLTGLLESLDGPSRPAVRSLSLATAS